MVESVRRFRRFRRRIPHAHAASAFGGRRARPRATAVSRATNTNVALAGLQLVIGYQWLVSGIDKILLGAFPAQVGPLLMGSISSGKLPAYFAALLQAVVVPNAPVFGYAVMLGETLAGLGLVAAGAFNFLRPQFETRARGRLWEIFALTDRLVMGLAPLAAVGAGLLGLSFYLLDGASTIWFTPSLAYGGAIAPELVLALASLVLVAAQVVRPRTGR
jgi:thiosulfate dehydrogenase [quinone] large subunit